MSTTRVLISSAAGITASAGLGFMIGGPGGAVIGTTVFGPASAVVGAASQWVYQAGQRYSKPARAMFAGVTSMVVGALAAEITDYFALPYAACRTDHFDYNNCMSDLKLFGICALPVGMFAVAAGNALANTPVSESKNIVAYHGFFEKRSDLDVKQEAKRIPALERRSNAIYRP